MNEQSPETPSQKFMSQSFMRGDFRTHWSGRGDVTQGRKGSSTKGITKQAISVGDWVGNSESQCRPWLRWSQLRGIFLTPPRGSWVTSTSNICLVPAKWALGAKRALGQSWQLEIRAPCAEMPNTQGIQEGLDSVCYTWRLKNIRTFCLKCGCLASLSQ